MHIFLGDLKNEKDEENVIKMLLRQFEYCKNENVSTLDAKLYNKLNNLYEYIKKSVENDEHKPYCMCYEILFKIWCYLKMNRHIPDVMVKHESIVKVVQKRCCVDDYSKHNNNSIVNLPIMLKNIDNKITLLDDKTYDQIIATSDSSSDVSTINISKLYYIYIPIYLLIYI